MKTVISKSAWSSRLVLLGAAEVLAGIVVLASDYMAALEAGNPVGWAFIVKGLATVILRMRTTQPVTLTGGTPVQVDDT